MPFYQKHGGDSIRLTAIGTCRHASEEWQKHWPLADSAVHIRLPLEAATDPQMGEWMGESLCRSPAGLATATSADMAAAKRKVMDS